MKIYLDNNLGVTNVEQEELTQDTIGYNILKVYIPNAVLTPYDTFTCYYGALLQNGRKVGWFAMEARTSTDADYEANYTLYKATLEQCVVSVEGKVYIGCQVLLGNSGNATLIKKNTAVVQFNVRKSVAINNDILVLDPDQTTTDVLESYKNLLENALTTYATKAEVYTKAQVDALLLQKADKSNTYTKNEVDGKLDLKADKSDTYTKQEVNNIANGLSARITVNADDIDTLEGNVTTLQDDVADLKSVQNVVEVVATKSALNSYDTTKLDANDKVQVIADETHDGASTIYNWNGSAWQYVGAFGGNSYTKAETYNKTQIDSALSDKADKSNTYTRAVIDSMILTLSTDKADKSDTYTKTEIDNTMQEVGEIVETLGKEVDGKLDLKADKSDTYTKTEVNGKLDLKADKTTAIAHTGNQLKDNNGNNIYPALEDGQVDIKKLNTRTINGMYAYAKSTNLFDRLSIIENTQINASGNLETYSNCYVMNKPISVTAGEKLVYFVDGGQESAISSDGFLAYYDIDGNFLSKTRADGGASGTTYTIVTSGITPNYYRVLVRYFTVPSNAVKAIWQGYTNQLNLIGKICFQHLSDFTGNYQDYYATKGSVDDYATEKIKFSWKPTWDISRAPYIFAGVQGADASYTTSALASVMVAINSCKISKNYRENRNKTSNHFSHDSTLQILNDKGYIIETRDETGTGDNPSVLTAYVGLTVYDNVKTLSTSSTNTKYDVAKNGDSVGALTIISGVAEANCYFIGTNLYIIFTCKLSDNNWYELYRIFDTTTNTFGSVGICKLGANDFTCANLCTALGIGDVQSSISMNATITTDGTYYYAGLCLGSNVPTSVIMYSSNFITWNVWLKPSSNAPTTAIFENALFVQGNFLYSACRQTNGFIWLAKIRISNKNIENSILINADSCRPDFFTDGTNLYLAYSVNNRNLTQIMLISTTLERSKVVSQILDECIYPSIKYASDNQVIVSATSNNSTAVYLRRTTEIEPYNIYDMIDLLPTMFSKFNEV